MSLLARRRNIAKNKLDEFGTRRLMKQGGILGTRAEVAAAQPLGRFGWVEAQVNMANDNPLQTHMINNVPAGFAQRAPSFITNTQAEAWWWKFLQNPDMVRSRMAFALSQIVVFSYNDVGTSRYITWSGILDRGALGNFRDFLGEVTRSYPMAEYLTYFKNSKEAGLGPTDRQPDENYAREILQLFTIGKYELNLDGTRKKKRELRPDDPRYIAPGFPGAEDTDIETYETTSHIRGMARVFTGLAGTTANTSGANSFANRFTSLTMWDTWAQVTSDPELVNGTYSAYLPLICYPQFHSVSAKLILPGRTDVPGVIHDVNGINLPALTLTGTPDDFSLQCMAEIDLALDIIFNHPNVGPFISRQLIQRLTTSNPSPQYIARVASVFNNNGQGVRGDMRAVARAILTDQDARAYDSSLTGGKLQEPLIMQAHRRRTIELVPSGAGSAPRFEFWPQAISAGGPNARVGQWWLASPSVFNFFQPDFQSPGAIFEAGLFSPEFQILFETTLSNYLNFEAGAQAAETPLPARYTDFFTALAGAANNAARAELTFQFLENTFAIRYVPAARAAAVSYLNATSYPAIPTTYNATFVRDILAFATQSPDFKVLR